MLIDDIFLKQRVIGERHPCFVIAEAGVNHNGSPEMAKRLVDVAIEAGADAVKFQTFSPDNVVTETAAKACYQKINGEDQETLYEMTRRLQLSWDTFRALNQHARDKGILFMSKGHKEDLDFLVELGVPMLKVDSASIIYYSYLQKAAAYGIPIILSTGGSSLGQVEKAINVINDAGNRQVILLHCTTAYPTPIDQVNLKAMVTLKNAFGVHVGLSDHSEGIEASLGAVALGAKVIEKHFTLDRTLPGPDHKASLEPDELKALIKGVRRIEAALGDFRKQPVDIERENMLVVRRSLVAEQDIRKGVRFEKPMLSFKRPSGGLGEEFLNVVLGRVAASDIKRGSPVTWDNVGGFEK